MAENVTGTIETTGSLLFYKQPEPLNSEVHGNLGVTLDQAHPFLFAKETQLVPITVAEFASAALSYPIIFAGTERTPAVVMGLQNDHNAYIDAKGVMVDGAYVPAFLRRYPFVPATNNGDPENLMVCVDRAAPIVNDKPELPFFENGKPSAFTNNAIEFIQNYEAETQGSRNFVKVMSDLDLFETQDVTIPQPAADGKSLVQQKIGEFVGLSQDKLNKLPTDKVIELRDNGGLFALYAQLLSQANWQRVVAQEMKNPSPATAAATATKGNA